MKTKFKEVRPTRSKSYLKHKLISAAAMLVVSAIMMVSSSYAWYVLSTAPEVSNIKTQVGANGALEIALLNGESWTNLSLLDMGDIDESAGANPISAALANLTWGNLVNLDDSGYGLDKIVLQPARLFIQNAGSEAGDEYKVNEATLLKTPIYGEDGRVKGLETTAVAYTHSNGSFNVEGDYGVRAIGTSADMSVFQLGMNAARSSLITYATAAKSSASNSLQDTGGDLANIVVTYAISNKTEGFTNSDVTNIKALADGLNGALDAIDDAMHQVFAGYITTTGAYYVGADGNVAITSENYQAKLAEITNTGEGKKTLDQLLAEYPGVITVIPNMTTHITKFNGDRTKVVNAIATCDSMIKTGDNNYTWSELSAIIMPLVNTAAMQVNGKTIEQLKTDLRDEDGGINMGAALNLVQNGLSITVPTGSGILSDIADFAGDYKANVTVTVNGSIVGMGDEDIPADVLMTAVGVVPTHMNDCSNGLKGAEIADATGSNSITDYYGYAIDLAFRTNASDSNLLLQTEPENRIYDGDERNASLQGGGSYMSFTTTAGLSATKMVRLMSGLRVVLMDGSQNILGIAVLDCTLGKDVYVVLDEADQAETKMYAYLDGSAGAYQVSDLIDKATYDALPETSAVEFNKITGKVTAKLYLYSFEMTKSTEIVDGALVTRTDGAGNALYTGGITIKEKIDNGVITALTPDVVQKVTVLVYLDGSVVNNSMVAANSMHSMTGSLNLQFSSSAELLPANNTQLQTSGSAVNYTELDTELYQNGYLYYSNALYKINDGYHIYLGSDDKLYTATGESEYAELTIANVGDVLTPVTASINPESVNLTVGGTADVTVTLSDASLNEKVTGCEHGYNVGSITVTEKEDNVKYTLEGTQVGESYFEASLIVKIGSESYKIGAGRITVTVTEAAGGQ